MLCCAVLCCAALRCCCVAVEQVWIPDDFLKLWLIFYLALVLVLSSLSLMRLPRHVELAVR